MEDETTVAPPQDNEHGQLNDEDTASTTTSIKNTNFNFLPIMSDIISRVQDSANYSGTDYKQTIYVRLTKLNEEMRQSLEVLDELPGTDMTREQQQERYEQLQKAYLEKTQLTSSFQQLPIFQGLSEEKENNSETMMQDE